MKLLDVVTSPWAIIPANLDELQAIYETHLRGEKIDVKGVEARIGKPLQNKEQGYEVQDGTAIIPIEGVIAKKMNLFSQISGGASTQLIARDIKEALADYQVKRILLKIDSPGGTVDGTQELANLIYSLRGQKPIEAFTDGTIASAAYWVAAATDKIWISNELTTVGSIGVVAKHRDFSKAKERVGVTDTEICAGKYKRIASDNGPLTPEGRADIQAKVDYIYSVFVEDVAKFRGVSVDTVLNDMADGRIFIGRQAIEAGLVDGVSTMDQLHISSAAGGAARSITALEETMDSKELKTKHPETYEAVFSEGKAAGLAEGKAASADETKKQVEAESERVLGIVSASLGDEVGDKLKAVIATGVTVAQYQAIQATSPKPAASAVSAEAAARAAALAALKGSGAENPGAGGDGGPGAASSHDFMALVDACMTVRQCTKVEAMRETMKKYPAAHAKYIQDSQAH